jgi:hypothetical protein
MSSYDNPKAKKFSWRGFASLVVTAGFLLMAVTGVMLYISPRGRTANWIGWEVLGLTKEEWAGLHVNLALILLAGSVLHLIYNWKPFISYLRSSAGRLNGMRRELALAAGVLLLAGAGSIIQFPPFGTVLAWEDDIKDYWETTGSAPAPYPHADETPLNKFAAESGLELKGVLAALRENGLQVPDSTLTIGGIAGHNSLVPAAVYEAIRSKFGSSGAPSGGHSAGSGGAGGPGTGSLTIEQACQKAGLELPKVLSALQAKGITANAQMRLYDIAPALGTTPGKVLQELRNLAG